jgi:hypothetical protein
MHRTNQSRKTSVKKTGKMRENFHMYYWCQEHISVLLGFQALKVQIFFVPDTMPFL